METAKIIIITNFHDDTDKGILNVLEDKDNDQSEFVKKYLYRLSFENEFPNFTPRITPECPYLFVSKDKTQSEFFADWQILLITDIYPPDDYLKELFDTNTFVMYHTTPSNIEKYLAGTNIRSKRKGKHEPEEKDGYWIINYLVNAYDATKDSFDEAKYNDAIRRLIDWFPVDAIKTKLNIPNGNLTSATKLNILHSCLTSIGASEIDKSLLNENQKVIVEFLAKQKDYFSEDYITKLTELRISFLGS